MSIKNHQFESAVATLKTEKLWVRNCSEILCSNVLKNLLKAFQKIVLMFTHSKSINISHQLKLYLSDRLLKLGQNKYTPQQWHFALSTMKLALNNHDITGCWLTGRRIKMTSGISKGYVRCQSPHLGTQERKIK